MLQRDGQQTLDTVSPAQKRLMVQAFTAECAREMDSKQFQPYTESHREPPQKSRESQANIFALRGNNKAHQVACKQ